MVRRAPDRVQPGSEEPEGDDQIGMSASDRIALSNRIETGSASRH